MLADIFKKIINLNINTVTSDLISLKGVGVKTCEHLAAIGIHNIQDLLFHLPFRYQDRTQYTQIINLKFTEFALVKAKVLKTEIKFGRRRSMLVWLEDKTGIMCLRYFHFSIQQKSGFYQGRELEAFGEVRIGPQSMEMIHPETAEIGKLQSDSLTPVYSVGKGLHQLSLRKITAQALTLKLDTIQELLPAKILNDFNYPDISSALLKAHQPPPGMEFVALAKGRERLVFEEILAHHLAFKKIRKNRATEKSVVVKVSGDLRQKCISELDFKLTKAQQTVLSEIIADMQSKGPMQRLLQGDVGSGKTIVALLSALECIEAGLQVAFMAPTEILVEQHFRVIKQLLTKLDIHCDLLVSGLKKTERKAVLSSLGTGDTSIIIGTHALFQKEVAFNKLGLVVVDEQHRFGVGQRVRLLQKAGVCKPHQLIMTATPIPRTLAMTFYAYLDYSVIDELPPGRTKIKTSSVAQTKRAQVIERLRKYCGDGKQAYWVCPLIEESEVLQCQAAVEVHKLLSQTLSQLKVGLVHGRLKRQEKDQIMRSFKAGDLDVLVATTVIEVGVDVPNASLMVIDNAERLGLSQLHQLRGRVGRGSIASFCVLLYETPLSDNAKARIDIMRETTDGFKIAERDLEIRGPGELLGTKQTGEIKFKLADLNQDKLLIAKVQQQAQKIEKSLSDETIEQLITRWVGDVSDYSDV